MTALRAIHAGNRQLGLDEDMARDLYERVTGGRSLRAMSGRQLELIVSEQRRLGFKPASKGGRKQLEGKYAPKLQALWIAGWNLGIVRDRDNKALVAFVKRQAGVDHVRFLHDPGDAARAIEGLKGWLARSAKVDWSEGMALPDWLRRDGAKIALAQWQVLAKAGQADLTIQAFRAFVCAQAKPIDQMENRDWIVVMNALGERVRKAVK